MNCSACGRIVPAHSPSCPACGQAVSSPPVASDGGLTSQGSARSTSLPDLAVTGEFTGMTEEPGATAWTPSPHGTPPPGHASSSGSPTAGRTRAQGPLLPGEAFGSRYHVIKLLGAGGMGAVYQAWDAELNLAVAIKVILPSADSEPTAAAELERRFKRELVLARQVTHKNVVRIHDLGEIDGIKYITMSYIEGEDLASVLKREGRIPVPRALEIARSIVAGLVAAHDAGIVHRDLKPANIMVDTHGDAVIMDFGIARSTDVPLGEGATAASGGRTRRLRVNTTSAGDIVGTVQYMAPEQAKAQPVDQRADIYALGLILYDMLVGGRAIGGSGALAELKARMVKAPASPRSLVPEVPEALDQLIVKCLDPNPSGRFETTKHLAAALDRFDADGQPIKIRRVVGIRALAAVVVVAASTVGWVWWTAGPSETAPLEPISILIADFENRTNDAVFDGAVENALGIALEGASFITTYRRADAHAAIQQLSPGARLDRAGARLVSAREGIKVVVTGSIERSGSGYTVAVDAIDSAVDAPLATASERAASTGDVLRVVGTLASEIRSALGDETPETARLSAAETVTAASLEALQNYTRGQELQINSKYAESIEFYERAIEQDPRFGRAYASWAVSAYSLGRRDEAEVLYKKAFALMDRMTEREKYRTYGTYYLTITQNYSQAIENYTTLLKLYPADRAARTNLAFTYFAMRDFSRALEENRRALDIYPGTFKLSSNHALYAMYAGDFAAAEKEAARVVAASPSAYRAYLPRAMAALDRGELIAAREAYAEMAKVDRQGASLASMGLADLLMYAGQLSAAEAELRRGIVEDEAIKSPANRAAKYIALAEALAARKQTRAAAAAVDEAVKAARNESTLFAAARVHVALGNLGAAREMMGELDKRLQPEPRAYARIIDGDIAARESRWPQAVEAFNAALKIADVWLAHLSLGIAYVEAGAFAEGLQELETSRKRRGEATAVFLNDVPSFRHLAPLSYWLARAQEGIGQAAAAAENYKTFVTLRAAASEDPLIVDARRRLP
jgi:eukaryotic-like serine/threonine-protein kinase